MPNAPIAIGDYGASVARMQDLLRRHGFEPSASELSRQFFGPTTRQAVQRFQQRNGLPVTGAADERTAALLDSGAEPRQVQAAAEPSEALRHRPPLQASGMSSHLFYWLFDSYLRFGEELWGRSWHIASDSLRRAMRGLDRSVVQPHGTQRLLRNIFDEYTNVLSGMAMALPLAAEAAAASAAGARRMERDDQSIGIEGAAPRTIGVMRELHARDEGTEPTPFVTPARITDASQGWAAYVVPCATASEILGGDAEFFVPYDIGGGRTLFGVLGVEYRVSDFGQYREIALALTVSARSDRAGIPAAMFVGIVVTGEFSRDVARAVWGLRKILNKDLSVAYQSHRVDFRSGPNNPEGFSISFPRFGRGRFDNVPVLVYSRQDSSDRHGGTPMRSVLSLSGRGQGLQVGGSVSMRLGTANPAACLCRGAPADCLCRILERFEVRDRLPIANGWTEHLSGTLDAPRALHLSR
jgi:hypothetical protein